MADCSASNVASDEAKIRTQADALKCLLLTSLLLLLTDELIPAPNYLVSLMELYCTAFVEHLLE